MDEARRTPGPEVQNQSQIRRAQRGVVAGYIHGLSERHDRHAPDGGSQPSHEGGEGS